MKTLLIKKKLTGRTKEEKLQKFDSYAFKAHVLNYGIILSDDKIEDKKGHYRYYNIYINGMIADIKMFNGDVVAWGLTVGDIDIINMNNRLERENIEYKLTK